MEYKENNARIQDKLSFKQCDYQPEPLVNLNDSSDLSYVECMENMSQLDYSKHSMASTDNSVEFNYKVRNSLLKPYSDSSRNIDGEHEVVFVDTEANITYGGQVEYSDAYDPLQIENVSQLGNNEGGAEMEVSESSYFESKLSKENNLEALSVSKDVNNPCMGELHTKKEVSDSSKSSQNNFVVESIEAPETLVSQCKKVVEATTHFNETLVISEHKFDFNKSLQDHHVKIIEKTFEMKHDKESKTASIESLQTHAISEYEKVSSQLNNPVDINKDKSESLEKIETSRCERMTESAGQSDKTFEETEFVEQSNRTSKQTNEIVDKNDSPCEKVAELSDQLNNAFGTNQSQFGHISLFKESVENVIDTSKKIEATDAQFRFSISMKKESLESPQSISVSKEMGESVHQLIKTQDTSEDQLNIVEPIQEFVEASIVAESEKVAVCVTTAHLKTFEANELTNEIVEEIANSGREKPVEMSNQLNKTIETNASHSDYVEPLKEPLEQFQTLSFPKCEKAAESSNPLIKTVEANEDQPSYIDQLNRTFEGSKTQSDHIVKANESTEPPQTAVLEGEHLVEVSNQNKTFEAAEDKCQYFKSESLKRPQNIDISENTIKSTNELTFESTEEMPERMKTINELLQTDYQQIAEALLNETFGENEVHCDRDGSPQTFLSCDKIVETSQLNKTVEINGDQPHHVESIEDAFGSKKIDSLNKKFDANKAESNHIVEVKEPSEPPQTLVLEYENVVETSDQLNITFEGAKNKYEYLKSETESLERLQSIDIAGCENTVKSTIEMNKTFEATEHVKSINKSVEPLQNDCVETLNETFGENEVHCNSDGSPQTPQQSDSKKIVETVRLNKTVQLNDHVASVTESIIQSDFAVSGYKKVDEISLSLNKTVDIDINEGLLQGSIKPLQDIATLECEKTVEISEPLNKTIENNKVSCDHVGSPQTFTLSHCKKLIETDQSNETVETSDNMESVKESPIQTQNCVEILPGRLNIDINEDMLQKSLQDVVAVSGSNKLGEIENMPDNVKSINQSIETPDVSEYDKVVRVKAQLKESLQANESKPDHDFLANLNSSPVTQKQASSVEQAFIESETVVEALARSLNQTIDVEESAIAEDDEFFDACSNNFNVTVKVTPEKENNAIEESEHHSERMVTELEVALNTKSTEFSVNDNTDGEKPSENEESPQAKYKRIEGRRNIRALRNKTQVITDPLLLKIEPTSDETALVQGKYEQENDELKNRTDRLQQELNSILQDNIHKDKLLSHALDRRSIKKYEQMSQDYQRQIAKQNKNLYFVRKQLENYGRQFTSTEMAFSHVFKKYEKAKIIINGFRKNEANLTQNVQDAEFELAQLEAKCEAMEEQCKQNIKKAEDQVNHEKEVQKQTITKLRAMVKKLEIRASSLETALKQKTEECQAIAALCDDITGRQSI